MSDQDLKKLTVKIYSKQSLQWRFLSTIVNHEVVPGDFHCCQLNF